MPIRQESKSARGRLALVDTVNEEKRITNLLRKGIPLNRSGEEYAWNFTHELFSSEEE
jgi:hypothetical protein